jgi:ElaB/YqjD/DUF883 family membrane-anchored ribosome-binding protein
MAEEPDVIRHQIDETRESLSEKLDTLEVQVKGAVGTVTDTIETMKNTVEHTVESVRSGVEDTVASVKMSLHDTVDSVKETFDFTRQIDRHPWGAVGCSLLAGLTVGYLFERSRSRRAHYAQGIPRMDALIPGYRPDRPIEAPQQSRNQSAQPGFLTKLFGAFEEELDKVKELAIGAMIGMARDTLTQALPPSLAENVATILDDVTRRAGGAPIHGSVSGPERASQENGSRSAAVH